MHGWRWMRLGPWAKGAWGPLPWMHGAGPGPAGPRGWWRRFATRQEQLEWLRAYLDDLRQEVQAVEERIEDLERHQRPDQPPATPA